jgi:hypothetical protein
MFNSFFLWYNDDMVGRLWERIKNINGNIRLILKRKS